MPGPLAGIRVVDMTTVVMGPYATQILGDMGADVVKVEPPAGDVMRHAGPMRNPGMGSVYLNLNRNKRSIALDLKRGEDLEVMLALLDGADVFVSNARPQALRKLGLDYASLRGRNPRLVFCGTHGFSEEGPYAGRAAYDDVVQAMSGLAALQGHNREGGPEYVNTILADKCTGLTAAYAIAMALYEREKSGMGQAIEVPMFETLVSFNLVEHLGGEAFVPAAACMGYARVLSPHRRPYRTKDGFIGLLPYTDAHWKRFFERAGVPRHAADPRFSDAAARSRNIHALYEILSDLVATRTTAEWQALLEGADIPMAPIATPRDLLKDPHLAATGFFVEAEHPTEGKVRTIGIPVRFSRTPGAIRRLAPRLDEDGEEIRAGLNEDEP